MAENVTLARPYAEAVFRLARWGKTPQPSLAQWHEALTRMALVAADPAMRDCIGNPRLLPAQLFQLFLDVVGKLSEEQKNFVRTLVDNDRLPVLTEIRDQFVRLKNDYEGVKQAQISSAFALDDAAVRQLVAELESRFQCKLQAQVQVDPELIGGVKIAVGDAVIDASVRGKLAAMATALKN